MCQIPSHTNHLSEIEYSLYAKHFILEKIGIPGQIKLKNSKVLIIGAGGLGSPAILYLVASGIGYIGIIENDLVDLSNLNRQILYNREDVNKNKINSAKNKIHKINPFCQVITHKYEINIINAQTIIKYYDIILDCTDNFKTRYTINNACNKLHKTYIYGGIDKFEGQLCIMNYKSSIQYSDIYPECLTLSHINNCNNQGLIGTITGVIGILQATETIKIILGIGHEIDNKLLVYKLLELSFKQIKIYPQKVNYHNAYTKKTIIQSSSMSYTQLNYISSIKKQKLLILDIKEKSIKNFSSKYARSINIPYYKLFISNTLKFILEYHEKNTIAIHCNTIYKSLMISKVLKKYNVKHYLLQPF